ncbi:hypothetical protein PR202_ga15954 [Eleusine coracana subsp. coracana]|uniref:Chromo domain-containing protein n=1 Tax=Eleusine coracana subsp. coracana TaxID=191504 RepID=A0AAV5CKD6_ELECO|nr:hypothetical protein PR202_ga15954 [Eleusine coracana subsp. coracana]
MGQAGLEHWRPSVDKCVDDIKLELSRLNKHMERENMKNPGSKPGIFSGSAPAHTSAAGTADGPIGHRYDKHHRDHEFGQFHPQPCVPGTGEVIEGTQLHMVLQKRMISRGGNLVIQCKVWWSGMDPNLASWENLEALKSRFAYAPSWGQAAWLTPVLLNAVDIGSTNIRYYSPYYHKNFEVDETLEAPDAKICCANRDHLTLYHRDGHYIIVVHANLATGFIRKLEPLHIRHTLDFVIDDGELMAVLADRRGSPLYVVKLNEDTMEWEKVKSLEGRALFTGTLRTIMVNWRLCQSLP